MADRCVCRSESITDSHVSRRTRRDDHEEPALSTTGLAGAAPLAALPAEKDARHGRTVGVILCGGNVDTATFAEVLRGNTPAPF
mgnify:CR=1 FL=1